MILARPGRNPNKVKDLLMKQRLKWGCYGEVTNLYAIGDCVKSGRIINAIWEALHVVQKIEKEHENNIADFVRSPQVYQNL